MATISPGASGPTQLELFNNGTDAEAGEINQRKIKDQDQVVAAQLPDQDAEKAAALANMASSRGTGAPAPADAGPLTAAETGASQGPTGAQGPSSAKATSSQAAPNSLSAQLQQELEAQNTAHQQFSNAASSANVGNLISPRTAAAAAAASPAGPGGPAGPGLPPGFNGSAQPGQPGQGPMGSPLGAGQYGTAGNTFTDVATRQKAIQDDLNQAQTIYTQMAADRYKWISTMQRIWADMNTSILENLMAMVKNKIQTFNKMNEGIIGALFGG